MRRAPIRRAAASASSIEKCVGWARYRRAERTRTWPRSERLKKKGYVAVFLPTTFTQPALAGDGFMGGVADGQLALFSLEDGALVAHGPFQARSSETIQYKKRGFRFRRIPLGGSDNKAQALADDFAERCQEAVCAHERFHIGPRLDVNVARQCRSPPGVYTSAEPSPGRPAVKGRAASREQTPRQAVSAASGPVRRTRSCSSVSGNRLWL